MPAPTPSDVATPIGAAVVDVLGAQWGAVGPRLARPDDARAHALVDPEALLLASLAWRDDAPQLWRVLTAWSGYGSRFLSVQRTKNLSRDYAAGLDEAIADFARMAVDRGKDARWRTLAGPRRARTVREAQPLAPLPNLDAPPALVLRLRLGLGVGVKADVLAFLLGIEGRRATIPTIARATRYHDRAVRRATYEMAAARLVERARSTQAAYRVDLEAWGTLLDLDLSHVPPWRDWHGLFVFAASIREWARGDHPTTARLHELVAAHASLLERWGVRVPRLDAFTPFAQDLSRWIRSIV